MLYKTADSEPWETWARRVGLCQMKHMGSRIKEDLQAVLVTAVLHAWRHAVLCALEL